MTLIGSRPGEPLPSLRASAILGGAEQVVEIRRDYEGFHQPGTRATIRDYILSQPPTAGIERDFEFFPTP